MKPSIPSLLHLGLVCLGVGPLGLVAQQADQETRNWAAEGELGGNAFFGNTSQSAFTAALSGDVGRGLLQLDGRTGFAYGRTTSDAGETSTNKRAWDLAVRLDFDPGTSVGGFIVSKVESILEKRIDLRYSVGAGGRYQTAEPTPAILAGPIRVHSCGPSSSAIFAENKGVRQADT